MCGRDYISSFNPVWLPSQADGKTNFSASFTGRRWSDVATHWSIWWSNANHLQAWPMRTSFLLSNNHNRPPKLGVKGALAMTEHDLSDHMNCTPPQPSSSSHFTVTHAGTKSALCHHESFGVIHHSVFLVLTNNWGWKVAELHFFL